jgi:predicted MPP superfamily phosphohydrolase
MYEIIAIIMLGGDVLWWRWAARRTRGPWRIAISIFVLIQLGYLLTALLTPFAPKHNSAPITIALTAEAYLWHLLVLPFALLAAAVGGRWRGHSQPENTAIPQPVLVDSRPAEEIPRGIHRRDVLIAIPPILAAAALGVSLRQMHHFRIRRLRISLAGLPPALDGMTITQIADTHIGKFTDERVLRDIAAAANALDSDFTVFVGDLIDLALADLPPAIEFAKSLRARRAVFFCEGNHDLVQDHADGTDVFRASLRSAGLELLCDQTTTCRLRDYPLQFVGGRWNQTSLDRAAATRDLMRKVDPDRFSIFLSHHPHAWDDATTNLTLSGHTHGGQFMITERLGVGPILFRYYSGLYRRGDRALVVSNGTGNWYPLRINAPPEILHLTLTASPV